MPVFVSAVAPALPLLPLTQLCHSQKPLYLCRCLHLLLLLLQATQLINRLTPQKPARPAASDISKDE
jgi:hypothetical protein